VERFFAFLDLKTELFFFSFPLQKRSGTLV